MITGTYTSPPRLPYSSLRVASRRSQILLRFVMILPIIEISPRGSRGDISWPASSFMLRPSKKALKARVTETGPGSLRLWPASAIALIFESKRRSQASSSRWKKTLTCLTFFHGGTFSVIACEEEHLRMWSSFFGMPAVEVSFDPE